MAKRCKHCGNWVFDDNGEGYCEHCGRRNHTFRITMSGALAIIATIFILCCYISRINWSKCLGYLDHCYNRLCSEFYARCTIR